jgi:hypothetical protein
MWLVSAFLLAGAAAAEFEPPATFRAAEVLSAELRQGPHHTVADAVRAEGFYLQFNVASEFGDLSAEGRAVLRSRVEELDALARLSEVSRGEVFVKAAGGAVLNVGKGFVRAVQDPGATVKGIGGGLKRLGINLGRKAKRAADSVTKDDKKPEGPPQPAEDRALNAAGGAARSVLGVNSAARRWAQKLGVDPYTTNPVLHQALVDVGKIDRAGSIAARIVVPIPALVSTTATVGGLVWNADPEELRKINERRLAELGASKELADRYLINGNYTLTSQTRLIAALHAVRVEGCADYVDAASEAEDEREALFFVESAELLADLHRSGPVAAVLQDSRTLVARRGTAAIALLPFDWLRWTEALHKASAEIAARARNELGARTLEARLSGSATPSAKAGLAAAGWTVKEGVGAAGAAGPRPGD